VHLQCAFKHGGVDGHGARVDGQLVCGVCPAVDLLRAATQWCCKSSWFGLSAHGLRVGTAYIRHGSRLAWWVQGYLENSMPSVGSSQHELAF
jgi:hypothetical protein